MPSFLRNTRERATNILAQFLPDDVIFAKKNESGTVFRRTLEGIAVTFQDVENYIVSFVTQYNILITENFIDEWEASVGIPDNIFKTDTALLTIQERRNQVLFKLRANGAQENADFVALATLLGVTVTIQPATPSVNFWTVTGNGVLGVVPSNTLLPPFIPGGSLIQNAFEELKPVHTVINYIDPP